MKIKKCLVEKLLCVYYVLQFVVYIVIIVEHSVLDAGPKLCCLLSITNLFLFSRFLKERLESTTNSLLCNSQGR